MPTSCLVIGAGGHAKVVIDACQRAFPEMHIDVCDHGPAVQGTMLLGLPVVAPGELRRACHVAIGDNVTRRRLGETVLAAGGTLLAVVHPSAQCSHHARVDAGVLIAATAVVAPHAHLGCGTIVNHSAVVDHDCDVGAWTHIAPGVLLGGGVRIGAGCLIGSGAVVLPGIVIGEGALVGAGAVVTSNLPAAAKVVGVPARPHP